MCPHVFSLFSAHLFLPWHHNGKWSITKHTLQAIEVPGTYMYACTLLPLNLLSTSGSPRLSMSWVVPIFMCTCIACLVPRPHAFLDINYCVGLATKLCLSPCANLAMCRCCLVPILPCADVALWPIVLCRCCLVTYIVLCRCCLVTYCHATLALCQYCHATQAFCKYCHATLALCQYCHATLALCQCCHERDLQGHRRI